ncbi:MAG TPA: GAF domain-containing protein [Methylomirabilota bacterium]|nr:GAF domain-containing protein [Methylomirabilota bacterium]
MAHAAREHDEGREVLVSVAQAAALLGVHPNTVRSWTDAGRLPAYRINARGDRRYRSGDVQRLLAEGTAADTGDAAQPERRVDAELAVLGRLTTGPGAASNPTAVCRTAVEALRSHLRIARVAAYLTREGGEGQLQLETHAGYQVSPPDTLDPASGADSAEESGAVVDIVVGPLRRQLTLRAGGEIVGALVLEDDPGGPLAGVALSFLRTVATAVAASIITARALARAKREVTRSRALRHVAQELAGQLDLSTVLDDIVDRTRTLFDADKAGLWLVQEGEFPFHVAAARGLGDSFVAATRTLTWDSSAVGVQATRERRSMVVRNADTRAGVGAMQQVYLAEGIKTACLVPLVSHDQALGVIGLYHTRDREWPDDEIALAQSFANQAAVAISNARLYRSVADQAARIRSIQDLSSRLNRLTDVQAIADAIVSEASSLAAYHDIRVYVVNWDQGFCEPVAYTDRLLGEGDFHERLRVAIGEGSFTGWVAEHGEPLLINDALNDLRGHTIEGTDDIDESMLVVPMVFEGRAVGVVALSKLGRDQFSNDDLQTMMIFAGYAAQAIANASAYERMELQSTELARQLQSQRRLLEINARLLSSLDQQEVLDTIADGLRSVVHYDNLSIYRVDPENRVLMPVLTRERHAEQVMAYIVPFGRGLMGWATDHAEPVLANDALNDPRSVQIPGTPADPEALAVVPLVSNGEVIGCMNISRVGGAENHFSDNDFELIKLFAGQGAIALRNAYTHLAVSKRADTDALTGLGNHGSFQRTLGEVASAFAAERDSGPGKRKAKQRPVSLLMMDLDSFKGYNDRLGHPAGDALLHAVGTAIYGAARTDDRVYRYGGDEFALILPAVDRDAAAAIGERVRQAVARLTSNDASPVTISIGVATMPGDAHDKNELIAAADVALYHGKQSGGDRVMRASDVPGEMRDLRDTLERSARTALLHPHETPVGDAPAAPRGAGTPIVSNADEAVIDALLGLARSMDVRDPAGRGHTDRVALLAGRLARQLDCHPQQAAAVELAARLHALDLAGTKELEAIHALRPAAILVRQHRAGMNPAEALIGSQIVSVADAYDTLLSGSDGKPRGRSAALTALRAGIGTRYRAEVVEALATVVAARDGRGQHRRRSDAPAVESGAA